MGEREPGEVALAQHRIVGGGVGRAGRELAPDLRLEVRLELDRRVRIEPTSEAEHPVTVDPVTELDLAALASQLVQPVTALHRTALQIQSLAELTHRPRCGDRHQRSGTLQQLRPLGPVQPFGVLGDLVHVPLRDRACVERIGELGHRREGLGPLGRLRRFTQRCAGAVGHVLHGERHLRFQRCRQRRLGRREPRPQLRD